MGGEGYPTFSFSPFSFSPYSFSPCFLQKPYCTATAAKAMADRITRTEILLPAQACHIVKGFHQIRGQRQQFFHFAPPIISATATVFLSTSLGDNIYCGFSICNRCEELGRVGHVGQLMADRRRRYPSQPSYRSYCNHTVFSAFAP